MAKEKAPIPSGLYDAKGAAKRLGLPLTTFYHQVKTGTIPKISQPANLPVPEQYFSKDEINKIALAKELFFLLHSVGPVIFKKATSEDEVRGIVDMCVAIYGVGGTPSYETRLEIWQKSPDVYYVLMQEDIVVGYVSMIQFNEFALEHLMGKAPKLDINSAAGSGVYSITGPENIIPSTEGKPISSLFVSVGVRPGMSNQQQREYGFRILRGILEVLVHFAERGMHVKKILATSEKQDGIRLARKIEMEETKYPGDNLLRFEMDLETSNSRMALEYRQTLNEINHSKVS